MNTGWIRKSLVLGSLSGLFGVFAGSAFGQVAFDYGGAPNTYGTTLASGGASHAVDGFPISMGGLVDPETDGQPSALADGDDLDTSFPSSGDDEDGVTLIKNLINDDGGTAGVNDFGLTIGGTPVNSGDTLTSCRARWSRSTKPVWPVTTS